jgi:hypothetical protein
MKKIIRYLLATASSVQLREVCIEERQVDTIPTGKTDLEE